MLYVSKLAFRSRADVVFFSSFIFYLPSWVYIRSYLLSAGPSASYTRSFFIVYDGHLAVVQPHSDVLLFFLFIRLFGIRWYCFTI
jgi:hypothetical protein